MNQYRTKPGYPRHRNDDNSRYAPEPPPYLWCRCAEPQPEATFIVGAWQCKKCHHKCRMPI